MKPTTTITSEEGTITRPEIPSQYQLDRPRTPNEVLYDEAEKELEGLVPKELIVRLSDAACWRVNDAYDFGVAWGLGHFPELEYQGPSEALIGSLRGLASRLDQVATAVEGLIR
jgi:hypothetical protein